MLTKRKPHEMDMEAVMRAAREHGKMIELNAHPLRLDLDDVACAQAKDLGIPVVIATDSHRIEGLDAMRFGVQQARRGGLTRDDVANTRPWSALKKLLAARRKK
jgi:DNA polymerase (family 10)